MSGAGTVISSFSNTGMNQTFEVRKAKNSFVFTGANSGSPVFGNDLITLSASSGSRGSIGNTLDFTGYDNDLTVSLSAGRVTSANGDTLAWNTKNIGVSDVHLNTRGYGHTAFTGGSQVASVELAADQYSHNDLRAGAKGGLTLDMTAGQYSENAITGGSDANSVQLDAGQYSKNTVTGGRSTNTTTITAGQYSENTVTGGAGANKVTITAGQYSTNHVTGGSKDKVAISAGQYSHNTVAAGSGTNDVDITSGQYATNVVTGGRGTTTIDITSGQYSDNTVTGGSGKSTIAIRSGQYSENTVTGGNNTNKFLIDGNNDQYSETTITGGTGENSYTVANAGNQQHSRVTIHSSSGRDTLNLSSIDYASGMTAEAADTDSDGKMDSLSITSTASGQQVLVHDYFDDTSTDASHLKAGTGYIRKINFSDRKMVALGGIVSKIGGTISVIA